MRSSTQRRRERHYVAELLRRVVANAAAHAMASEIDAYGEGSMTYRDFRESRRYWLFNGDSYMPRETIQSAMHREAKHAAAMTLLYLTGTLDYYHRRREIRDTARALRECQLADIAPLRASPFVREMAQRIHEERDWEAMGVLYDALLDEGIDATHIKAEIHGWGCFVLEGLRC